MYKNILKYIGILQNYLYYLTIHINTRKWIIVLVIQRKVYRQRNLKLKKPNSLHYYLKERKNANITVGNMARTSIFNTYDTYSPSSKGHLVFWSDSQPSDWPRSGYVTSAPRATAIALGLSASM